MYFLTKWGAEEPQNPQNHRVGLEFWAISSFSSSWSMWRVSLTVEHRPPETHLRHIRVELQLISPAENPRASCWITPRRQSWHMPPMSLWEIWPWVLFGWCFSLSYKVRTMMRAHFFGGFFFWVTLRNVSENHIIATVTHVTRSPKLRKYHVVNRWGLDWVFFCWLSHYGSMGLEYLHNPKFNRLPLKQW